MTDYSATQKLDACEERSPITIIRDARDGLIPDEGTRPLFDALRNAPIRRGIKINRSTQLMYLEMMRLAL